MYERVICTQTPVSLSFLVGVLRADLMEGNHRNLRIPDNAGRRFVRSGIPHRVSGFLAATYLYRSTV